MQSHSSYVHTFYFIFYSWLHILLPQWLAAAVSTEPVEWAFLSKVSAVLVRRHPVHCYTLPLGRLNAKSTAYCHKHLVRLRSIKPCAVFMPRAMGAGYTTYVHVTFSTYMLIYYAFTQLHCTCMLHTLWTHICHTAQLQLLQCQLSDFVL